MFTAKQFAYDVNATPFDNFSIWFSETNYERYKNNEAEYTAKEASKIFNSLFAVNINI